MPFVRLILIYAIVIGAAILFFKRDAVLQMLGLEREGARIEAAQGAGQVAGDQGTEKQASGDQGAQGQSRAPASAAPAASTEGQAPAPAPAAAAPDTASEAPAAGAPPSEGTADAGSSAGPDGAAAPAQAPGPQPLQTPVPSAPNPAGPAAPNPASPASPAAPTPAAPTPAAPTPAAPTPSAPAPAASSPAAPPPELLKAREAWWRGDLVAAETAYLQLAQKPDASADVLGELGNLYFAQRKYAAAARYYERAGERLIRDGNLNAAMALLGVLQGIDPASAAKLRAAIDASAGSRAPAPATTQSSPRGN